MLYRGCRTSLCLGSNNFFDHVAFDKCEPLVATEVGIGQLHLVEAELTQDGCVDVAEMIRLFDGAQANGISRTHDSSAFYTTARHPHCETQIVMIAALAGLRLR